VTFLEKNAATTSAQPLPGVLIPSSAIRIQGDANLVFVVSDNRAQLRKVTLGQSYSDLRQVLEGVKANERVIIKPAAELKDGDRVQVELMK